MSGGHWDYFDRRFRYESEDFINDIKERFPFMAEILSNKINKICDIIHDIDWDAAGDAIIHDDLKFAEKAINKLTSNDSKYKDKYGHEWPFSTRELCPICGQPDNFEDCNHKKLSNKDVKQILERIREKNLKFKTKKLTN